MREPPPDLDFLEVVATLGVVAIAIWLLMNL